MVARDSVLVTGAYGLVGRPTVERLVADGFKVTATVHHTTKPALPTAVDVRSVDLTEPAQIKALVADVSPSAIVHLAAVLPPQCYAHPALARKVNVDATAALVRAAQELAAPPRFVHASSVAVHGSRNPHRHTDLLTPESPMVASDVYSCHKGEAENIVRASDLEWSILRLGGVMTLEPLVDYGDADTFYFGAALPADNRVHTVDVRDVAAAFSAAITTDVVREVFMIAGDDSHKRLQGEVSLSSAEAMGLGRLISPNRPGNPGSDGDWFPLDWMDTARAQQVLSFQRYSKAETNEEIRAGTGRKVRALRMMAPLLKPMMRRRAPYYKVPGTYADPWGRFRDKWGEPGPDA